MEILKTIALIVYIMFALLQLLKILKVLFSTDKGIFKNPIFDPPTRKSSLIAYYLAGFALLSILILLRLDMIEVKDNF